MRVGKKIGDKIAIPQAKKRFGWTAKILTPIYQTAKNLTQFSNILSDADRGSAKFLTRFFNIWLEVVNCLTEKFML